MIVTRSLIATIALAFSFVTGAPAQDFIRGRIQHSAGPVRVSRPKAPAAQEATPAQTVASKAGAKKHIEIDLGDFKYSPMQPALPDWPSSAARSPRFPQQKTGASQANLIDESAEMTIAWEEWHKRVSEEIYARWVHLGRVPGEARVSITVKRDGSMDWSVSSYLGPHSSFGFHPLVESHFRASVDATLASVKGSPAFEFPEKSQRQEVQLHTKFSSQMDNGPSGYSWKRGDYEKVYSLGGI